MPTPGRDDNEQKICESRVREIANLYAADVVDNFPNVERPE